MRMRRMLLLPSFHNPFHYSRVSCCAFQQSVLLLSVREMMVLHVVRVVVRLRAHLRAVWLFTVCERVLF